jgi:hypothetical protein
MNDFLCADWDENDWVTDCVGPGPGPADGNRIGGTGAVRKPPRPTR